MHKFVIEVPDNIYNILLAFSHAADIKTEHIMSKRQPSFMRHQATDILRLSIVKGLKEMSPRYRDVLPDTFDEEYDTDNALSIRNAFQMNAKESV